MKPALLALLLSVAAATPAWACPVCFGAAGSPQVKAMQMGILALLGVTVVVLGAFGAFILYLRHRLMHFDEAATAPSHSLHEGNA